MIDLLRQSHSNQKMTWHIQIRYKSVRSLLSGNVRSLNFVKSEKNLADNLTKGLPKGVYESSRGMGLSP